jgi:hypothetical protein
MNNYKKLIQCFENMEINYNNESDTSPYIICIQNAYKYIISIKQTLYKKFPSLMPSSIPEEYKELYKAISYRQSCCLFKCIQYIYNKKFTSAINEFLDAIEDYDNYKKRTIISINECLLFSEVLEIFSEQLSNNNNEV